MIRSKADYIYYLEADRVALSRSKLSIAGRVKDSLFPDLIWKFQRTLRKLEYLKNKRKGLFSHTEYFFTRIRFRNLSLRLGFTIPANVFGPGLSIAHYGTIIINDGTRVGANCRLHACVNIGTAAGQGNAAPTIGDNTYIGPGAKIFGAINIPNNTIIGANAVVNRSFEEENTLIAGVPAKMIGKIDIRTMLINATRIVDLGHNKKDLAGRTAEEISHILDLRTEEPYK